MSDHEHPIPGDPTHLDETEEGHFAVCACCRYRSKAMPSAARARPAAVQHALGNRHRNRVQAHRVGHQISHG